MSNETQKPNHAKTKWAPSKPLQYGLVGLAITAILLPFFFQSRPTATLRRGDRAYHLEIVSSEAARAQGLSGRQSLAGDRGMLFVFPGDSTQCIWMKDMRFSLDIVWLDSEKRVVHIEDGVSPDTYPHQFCPEKPTRYIIELNTGEAEHAGLKVGQTLIL